MAPLIIANWKMNFTFNEAISFTKSLSEHRCSKNLIIAPPTAYITYLKAHFEQLNFCVQDVSIKNDFGSYTGENSAKLFKSCGIVYAIVGHNERRIMFGETNNIVQKKAQNCLDNDITPIICIGETLEIRQNLSYKEFLLNQLAESVPKTNKSIFVAYEPIWSVGTKVIPTIEEIEEIFQLVKHFALSLSLDSNIQLVYGGSANSENCKDLFKIPDISGILFGRASLSKDELFKILNL